jgi:hypothetical protein
VFSGKSYDAGHFVPKVNKKTPRHFSGLGVLRVSLRTKIPYGLLRASNNPRKINSRREFISSELFDKNRQISRQAGDPLPTNVNDARGPVKFTEG